MSDQNDTSTPQDKLAKALVEKLLDQLVNEGRADSSFLQVCRQVCSDSGAEYLDALDSAMKIGRGLPAKPELPGPRKLA